MSENKRTLQDLQQMQGLPLNIKIRMTEERVRAWVREYGVDGVYLSFSGGKDSTVLLHIVRKLYPDVKAVFANTGLEFPEIVKFVKTFSNVDIVRPKMTFTEVIKKYGYPMISKEVSECVFGARKYLTQVLAENSLATDRQTDIPYAYRFKRLCGLDEYKKYYGGGGFENKYRRLRGIGNYATNSSSKNSSKLGDMDSNQASRSNSIWAGGECWRFAKLTGICTTQNTVDARLWKDYRQFADSTSDGNQSEERKSNDGDYP